MVLRALLKGRCATHSSLINDFFKKNQNHTTYTSTTFVESNLNSDHLPIILHIPPNKLIAQQPPPPITRTTRIMNPIPQENLEKFKTKFFEENAIQLNNITTLFSLNQLTQNQWQSACTQMDYIIQKISKKIENTCSATPMPQGCQIGRPRGSWTSRTSSGRKCPDVRLDTVSAG